MKKQRSLKSYAKKFNRKEANMIIASQRLKGQGQFQPDTDTSAEAFDLAGIKAAEEQFVHYDIFDKCKQGKFKI